MDASGNNRNGTYSDPGTIGYSFPGSLTSDTDTGVSLDGFTGTVSIPWNTLGLTTLTTNGSGYTFELFMATTSIGQPSASAFGIIAANNSSSTKRFVITLTPGAGTIDVMTGDSYVITRGNTAVNDGFWHHLVISIVNGAHPKIYIDGVEDTYSATSWLPPSSGLPPVYIGFNARNASYLTCVVDEFAAYNGELTATRVAAHYAAAVKSTSLVNVPLLMAAESVNVEAMAYGSPEAVAESVNTEVMTNGTPQVVAETVFVEVMTLPGAMQFTGWGIPI